MSTIKADTVQSTSGGAVTLTDQYAPKAWMATDGDSTIKGSAGMSSLTDNSSGDQTFSFTNSFTGSDYCGFGMSRSRDTAGTRMAAMNYHAPSSDPASGSSRVCTNYENTNLRHTIYSSYGAVGDLA